MEDWTRVLLYGTFDGFTYSTDDLLRITVVLDGGEKVEVPGECVVSADEMINKNKIKLKDVIARIKSIDLDSQEVWLNEILNELGSDYGSLKYRAGYEQGRFDGAMEREKVIVPQFVANWYEKHKYNFEFYIWDYVYGFDMQEDTSFKEWFDDPKTEPFKILVNMHQFGYEVEKERRYRVNLKNGQPLLKAYLGKALYFSQDIAIERYKVTRKELEQAGFGWVFDCPGIEIEEVEE